MKHKIILKDEKYYKKLVLERHEKFAFVVIILTNIYILLQVLRYFIKRS